MRDGTVAHREDSKGVHRVTVSGPTPMSGDGSTTARRLADAVATHYHREVRSIARIARGMGTTNWLVCAHRRATTS